MSGRIRPSQKRHEGKVPEKTQLPDESLIFSFKHLDLTNPKFCTDDCGKGYIGKFLERLQKLNLLPVATFKQTKHKSLRNHRIRWEKTTEPDGFARIPSQLQDQEAWQFEISVNEYGRVHGILLDTTFYIVWLDPLHRLYC